MGLVNRCECWVPVSQAFKGSAGFIESTGWRTSCNMWDAQTAEQEVAQS